MLKLFINIYKNFIFSFFFIACFFVICTGIANAKKISIIRDTEIENTIRELATPVFKAAKLDPNSVKIHLILDKSLNAFVAGGQRLFIHTGLITESSDASQIIGVIAHETGHIAGGHLARVNKALEKTTMTKALSVIMGATAIVAGQGKVGQMIVMAGDGIAQSNFFRYSQTQESAADQAALRFLDESKQSAKGLLSFMNLLGDQESLIWEYQDLYARTHPLTRNRITSLSNHIAKSPYSKNTTPSKLNNIYRRARAKLIGFVNPISRTLLTYKSNDYSLESRYARAIGYFKQSDMSKALPLIDSLLDEYPQDPYFWELKGQMIFESGDAQGALNPYLQATRFLPESPLIKRDLARVQLALNDPNLLNDIIINLKAALSVNRDSPFTWRQLAIAYGRRGEKGYSSLALAEEALLTGRLEVARYHGGLAERIFPEGSREWIQAQDILNVARNK
jgi:predicted Zn-dependent protease